MPLGEEYKKESHHFKPDGVLVGTLIDGPFVEGKPLMMYIGPFNDNRVAWLTSGLGPTGQPEDRITYGQFKTAKAFYRFLEDQR